MPNPTYTVLLTAGAEQDLRAIYTYIVEVDGPSKAKQVLNKLMKATESLSNLPKRGSHPKELLNLGIQDYRQIFFKPYRLIYRVMDDQAASKHVVVYLIVDGRRDMQTLLTRRLLSP